MGRLLGLGTLTWLVLAGTAAPAEPAVPDPASGVEIYEKQIRPLLADNCYSCHGSKKQESGLSLNSRGGLSKGGDRGPPISPGDPDASLLIQAIRYTDDDLKMPPRGKLKDEQIVALVNWVKLGAPMPRDDAEAAAPIRPSSDFNLAERRKHWAYQPVGLAIMSLPADASRCASPIDAFILARLEAAQLSPAPPAEKRTLIRRLTFDLTGLPPTPQEVATFLGDQSPDAYERLVDRLLASPHYGERFGRHWLDVVRYSETLGFEFDYDLHNAWRYRDYVIRAFNADVPYDQFVIEHLAGDLVPQARRNPLDGCNESILATGYLWMHEGKQTPVDIRQYQADCIDNQLDVLGKAFLGQTIACARCHDHKFDAISTRDYYALAGYLRSSRYQQAFIDPPERIRPQAEQLAALRAEIADELAAKTVEIWQKQAGQASRYLFAAASVPLEKPNPERGRRSGEQRKTEQDNGEQKGDDKVAQIARAAALDATRLKQWVKALGDESITSADHPLYAFAQRAHQDAKPVPEARLSTAGQSFENFSGVSFDNWFATGEAFSGGAVKAGELVIGPSAARPIARLTSGGADSGLLSLRLQGELRSPSFTIDKKFVHFRLAGRNARVNLVIDGYTLIMNPMYGKLTIAPASDRLTWATMPVDRWVGHRAFVELSDSTIPMHGLNPPPSPARMPIGPDGYVALADIVLSDDASPPIAENRFNAAALERRTGDDLAALASAYQDLIIEAIERCRFKRAEAADERSDDIALLNWLLENGLLDADPASTTETGSLATDLARYHELEIALPAPQRAAAIADGTGEDEFIFLRGNWHTPGERAPRDLPQVLPCSGEQPVTSGSGRLELANRLVDPANPLLPRVMANRLWQHHFGEGIVRTPDDFGRMGQTPSHPELLDYLASELIRSGWSMKSLTRQMVTSMTYRQSSSLPDNPQPVIRNPQSIDPDNRLLYRMPVRRLEAEAIRDSILAVSGRLSGQMNGPSVLPHVTPYMEGRGKPQSGPLDGEGRRSLYINARRNFLTPLLLAFDYPVTFTPIGRRGAATIPSQALALMNDPLVVSEAKRWADQTLAEGGSTADEHVQRLYQTAFARPPSEAEMTAAIDFLQEQSLRHGGGSDDPRVWTDLCHVLINAKEFIFIE